MKMIPQVKEYMCLSGSCAANGFAWRFEGAVDERVVRAAHRIGKEEKGIPVFVSHEAGAAEGYTLTVAEHEICIHGAGAAGAFYGIGTLSMLAKAGKGVLECCRITDAPDMSYRGFYQDTTRGRIPTLATLKKLVDTMAEYKLNSLQLYVEHSYEFREYGFCKEQLGYLTKEEIRELDAYCHERFIELIPSLSCFGHLYHLLQSEQYRHLCELKDYTPTNHYFLERMAHHTINPLLEESFSLITSLIDQHMEAFTSDKFNICCDETFDLGRDVNQGKDRGELYIGFVKKLVAYLESKGKTVMMWGDIALQHPDRLCEFPENLIFLNWFYDAKVKEERFAALADKHQIVCPGTNSWCGFHERVEIEEPNITTLAAYGKQYGAQGILNTNWGDLGNPASIEMAMYGLILGAACGWNNDTVADAELKRFVAEYHYGAPEALEILTALSEACSNADWLNYHWSWRHFADTSEEAFRRSQAAIQAQLRRIEETEFADPEMKREFLLAAKGDSLLAAWSASTEGACAPSEVDFDAWVEEYRARWLRDSKPGELEELIRVFTAANQKAIAGCQ